MKTILGVLICCVGLWGFDWREDEPGQMGGKLRSQGPELVQPYRDPFQALQLPKQEPFQMQQFHERERQRFEFRHLEQQQRLNHWRRGLGQDSNVWSAVPGRR